MPESLPWSTELRRWLRPFVASLSDPQRLAAQAYVRGLLATSGRKSITRIARRIGESPSALHHFIAEAKWSTPPVEAALLAHARKRLGQSTTFAVIRDVRVPKKGASSVGVQAQRCGAPRATRCQCFTSLTLVSNRAVVPVAWWLYLPEEWLADPDRRARTGIPPKLRYVARSRMAVRLLDTARRSLARELVVVSEAEYSGSSELLTCLARQRAPFFVRLDASSEVLPLARRARARGARELWFDAPAASIVVLRSGRGTDVQALAVRKRPSDPAGRWLVRVRYRRDVDFYVTNLSADKNGELVLRAVRALVAARYVEERLRTEIGITEFEGRSWLGVHHHAALSLLALGFLEEIERRVNYSAVSK